MKNREEMFAFYQTLIDEHRETLNLNNARDLIDVYLIEIEKAKIEGRDHELFEGRDHGKLNINVFLVNFFHSLCKNYFLFSYLFDCHPTIILIGMCFFQNYK